ncbi:MULTISPECIES: hypothetical protein [unclassified Mesorhizobium]|uniref:hypothetical protein n=1 Tax=unclassified Mesorhizobium TaxID=325217 RepID=UPI0006F82DA0|nr:MULTISPECIES: hypothetical protein [unclassified Mesorhizobium]KQZ15014.1 hypothetical protein ASD27_13825 [Mesorhizobium sp. Root1471]KQZ37523.1 hypothetical protein ASD44_13820 [Mesorhizobium sp. Root554]MDR7033905.1 hypothetical protein [Mesorhizobium sp. BE184]
MTITLQRQGNVVSLVGEAPADPADGERYVEAIRRISSEPGPFVLLVDIGVEINLTDAQRKAQNLWYKADRETVEAACRACALVRPAADDKMQRVWQGLFDFPVLVTRSRAKADAFLNIFVSEPLVGGAHQ